MEDKFEIKKHYHWDSFKYRSKKFFIYLSQSPFNKIFLGGASFRFKNEEDPEESLLRIWDFHFTDTTPEYIKNKLISYASTKEGNVSPEETSKSISLEPYGDLYEQIFARISPGNDETDRGMKNFYKNIYSRIEDPEFKKYIYETIKEWSKPEYVLTEQCQYILKEILEKEGEPQ